MKEKKLYYTKFKEIEPVESTEDESLDAFIKDNYDFEVAYIPEGYNVCFMLSEESDNPVDDSWKIVFFKEAVDLSSTNSKAITLDNIDEMENFENSISYQVIKEIDTNFEGTVDTARDLIENHRGEIEGKHVEKKAIQ